MDMTSAYAPSEFVFVVEFAGESYWHLHTVGYKPIIPMHVFTEIGPDNWTLWDPNPPAEKMVTSGPFNVSAYETGELLEFTYNPNYFLRVHMDGYSTTSPPESSTPQPDSVDSIDLNLGIAAAVVVVSIGFHTLYRRRYHA
jgi:ABC-type transport system substrate-binding protein